MGAADAPGTVDKYDLAAGGEVTYVMTSPEGDQSRGCWRVTSVHPPRSLEFTDGFANEDGTLAADLPTAAVQVRLVFDSGEDMRQWERWGAFEGLPRSVGQMDAVLAPD